MYTIQQVHGFYSKGKTLLHTIVLYSMYIVIRGKTRFSLTQQKHEHK